MRLRTTVCLLFFVFCCASFAHAQHVDAYFGAGTATDSSTGEILQDVFTGNPVNTPDLDGVFGILGGGLMLTNHFGVGGEVNFRFAQGDYVGLGYRPILYDFNGIYMPTGFSRVAPEIQGGIGGVNMRFYGGQQVCDPYSGTCSNFLQSSNHFQAHAGFGIRFYLTQSIFVRPQFDIHWVNNFTEFGHNYVPSYGAVVGFTF